MQNTQVVAKEEVSRDAHISSQLKKGGIFVTHTRVNVLSAFYLNNRSQLSANEIYSALQKNGTRVSLSTIYSVVTFLTASGLLRITSFQGKKYYEFNYDSHPAQLVCGRCGFRQKFSNVELINCCKNLANSSGYSTENFSLVIKGVCNNCRF